MPLSGSERVKMIKVIASRLGKESWRLIDVTLNQFGVQTPNNWSGDTEDYILNTIANGTDQALIELAQHVGYKFQDAAPTGVDPAFWRQNMMRLFASHLAVHRAFAGDLQQELLRYGITSFIAHNDIEPSLEWQTQIEMALTTCEALIALLHEKFHASNWTDQEIGFAMGRRVPATARPRASWLMSCLSVSERTSRPNIE